MVGGPDAGTVLPLPIGSHVLGRGVGGLHDESLSRQHLRLDVTPAGATVVDLHSTNGTTLEGQPVPVEGTGDPLPLVLGQVVAAGDSLLVAAAAVPADAAVHPGPEGTVEFTRPPRLLPGGGPERIPLPVEPTEQKPRRIPIAAMVAPLVLGVVVAFLFHQPIYLLFALATPVMAGANAFSDRRQSAKDRKAAAQAYDEAFATAMQRLGAALEQETRRRRDEVPDAAATLLTAVLPTRRLWERRRTDADFLVLRVGTADLPSRVELEPPRSGTTTVPVGPRTLHAVPVTVPLADVGVLGLAGEPAWTGDLARWLVTQVAVGSGPRDVALTVLAPGRPEWEWVRWLPHAAPEDRESAVANLGTDPETIAARVGGLLAVVEDPPAAARGGRPRGAPPVPRARRRPGGRPRAAQHPRGGAAAARGPRGGAVRAVPGETRSGCCPRSAGPPCSPPPRCPGGWSCAATAPLPVPDVLAERISEDRALAIARALAPVREVVRDDEESSLPESVRLLDVLSLEPPTADAVRARWQLGGRTTRLPIGIGSDGVFSLDLRRDGPHGLIAGTTGSGKSELLQSIIASARGGQPARRAELRAGRLQGRQRVQGLRRAAAHRRHGHRPRRPPGAARADLARRGAAPPRAPAGRAPASRTSRTTPSCARGGRPPSPCPGCSS